MQSRYSRQNSTFPASLISVCFLQQAMLQVLLGCGEKHRCEGHLFNYFWLCLVVCCTLLQSLTTHLPPCKAAHSRPELRLL
jgi:hypothetical protein